MPTSPSSASSHKLNELRTSLRELNRQLFKTFLERRRLVAEVQLAKPNTEASFKSFDAGRELQFFQELQAELAELTEHELCAFSLLMEGHAGAPSNYPAWSEGVHLLEAPSHKEHRMNPLLLRVLRPKAFAALRLAPHFGFLRSI